MTDAPRHRRSRPLGPAVTVLVCASLAPTAVGGVVSTWIGPDGGSFGAPRNWTEGAPGSSDTALFLDGEPVTVNVADFASVHRLLFRGGDVTLAVDSALSSTAPSPSAPSISIVDTVGGSASVTLSGGQVIAQHVGVGLALLGDATMTIASDALLTATAVVGVGNVGGGTLHVNGELEALSLQVGVAGVGDGAVTVSGGTATIAGPVLIANLGVGALVVTDGGTLSAPELIAAMGISGRAALEVIGAGSAIELDGELRLAPLGEASLLIADGGQVTVGGDMLVTTCNGTPPASASIHVEGLDSRLDVAGNLGVLTGCFSTIDMRMRSGGRVTVGGDLALGPPSVQPPLRFLLGGADPLDAPWIDVVGSAGPFPTIRIDFDPADPPAGNSEYLLIAATTIQSGAVVLTPLPGQSASWSIVDLDTGMGIRQALRVIVTLIGDLDGDGVVDGSDLGALLASWGPCAGCPADLNGDGIVDGVDLGILLGNWSAP